MPTSSIHTTNGESLLSNVYFSPEFEGKREQWRKVRSGSKKPSREAESGYKAIERSMVVSVDCRNGSNMAFNVSSCRCIRKG